MSAVIKEHDYDNDDESNGM